MIPETGTNAPTIQSVRGQTWFTRGDPSSGTHSVTAPADGLDETIALRWLQRATQPAYVNVDSALLDGSRRAEPSDSGAWDCAAFIAVEAQRGRGRGAAALEALVAEVFGCTLATACTLRVPIAKEHAVRAIEAAGFRWLRIEHDPVVGRVWLMRRERPHR